MPYDLTAIAKRTRRTRKKSATFRDIPPSTALANDLYATCYAPVVAAWTAATPAIMAEYERTLAAITTDTPADLGAQINEVENGIARLFITIRPLLERLILRTELWHRGKWRGAALSATGVDVGTLIGPDAVRGTLGAAIERNVGLIKDISAQARNRITDSVFRGLQQRRPARDVAKEIRQATGMARDRSVRVASDQLAKITEALSDERRREAGLDKWEWKWSGKQNGRPEHIARDGKIYSDADAPEDRPGELPFCGCRSLSVIEF
jgi:SPP1 gp7 family putative phage head morphogenesis protein